MASQPTPPQEERISPVLSASKDLVGLATVKGIYKQVLDEDYEKVGEGHLTGEHRAVGTKDGTECHRRRRHAQKAYVPKEF